MRKRFRFSILLFVVFIISLLFFSCELFENMLLNFKLEIVNHSGCKSYRSISKSDSASLSETSMHIAYDESGGLEIFRENIVQYCGGTKSKISCEINDNIIIFTEEESITGPLTMCLCLVDIKYKLEDVEPGTYIIEIKDEDISEEVELNSTGSSYSFYYEQDGYPYYDEEPAL